MDKREYVIKLVRKYPDTPNLTLAKKIMKDKPELFPNVESARSYIRAIKGANKGATIKPVPDLIQNRDEIKNPFKLPESEADDWTRYAIKGVTKLLVLADIHLPYHDVEAVTAAIKEGKKEKVDGVLINGDLLDFHTLSRFVKDPTARSFWGEVEMGREFFKILRKEFPKAQLFYKIGNHEERWENYMRVKAPEILDCSDFKLDVILRLAESGVQYIDNKRIIECSGLLILHGHEFFGSPSQAVNPARGLFLKTYTSSMIGHLHKSSEHTEYTLDGKIKTTWSTGCLCYLTPEYARINKWNHGAAIVSFEDGNYNVRNFRIYNGKVL
jgi:predicted phosphodiesterase